MSHEAEEQFAAGQPNGAAGGTEPGSPPASPAPEPSYPPPGTPNFAVPETSPFAAPGTPSYAPAGTPPYAATPGPPSSGQVPYSPPSYSQPTYGQQPYGQLPSGQPNGQPPTGQPPYGQPPYGQPQYGHPQYGQPYGGPPYQSPYGQVPGGPPVPPKKHTGRSVAIALIAVALVAAAAVFIVSRLPGPVPVPSTSPAGHATTATAAADQAPETVVESFLEAVAASQADVALGLLNDPPADTTFLTDAVLTQSASLAALTNIQTSPAIVSGKSASVSVTYRLGDTPVSDQYTLTLVGQQWLISTPLATQLLFFIDAGGAGLAINGVPLDGGGLLGQSSFLPGTYAFSVTNSYLTTSTRFVVGTMTDPPVLIDSPVSLAADAGNRLSQAAQQKLEACLAAKEAQPAGCGFGTGQLRDGATPDWSTVTRTVTAGTVASAVWTLGTGNVTHVSADLDITLDVKLHSTAGSQYGGDDHIWSATADISNPDAVVITFG